MKKYFLPSLTILFLICAPALAQKSISLSSYYPSPSGSYNTLDVEELNINGQTLNIQNGDELTATKITATSQLKTPTLTAPGGYLTITPTLRTSHIYVGGTGNGRIRARHLDGKKLDSTDVDHLYINYNTGKDVFIGHHTDPSDLLINGGQVVIRNAANIGEFSNLQYGGIQLGNPGENRIVAGRSSTGGYLDFYVNNTNNGAALGNAPDGIRALRLESDGDHLIGGWDTGQVVRILGGRNGEDILSMRRYSSTGTLHASGSFHAHNSDPTFVFNDGDGDWAIGVDDSSNAFGIARSNRVATNTLIDIRPNGNVGIGLLNAPSKLSVMADAGNSPLDLRTPDGYVQIGPRNASFSHFYTDRPRYYFNRELRVASGRIGSYNENLSLTTNGATRVTITDPDGNLGIGITAPTEKLHVVGNALITGNMRINGETRLDGRTRIYDSNLEVLDTAAPGAAAIYSPAFYYNSDEKLKENITPINNALTKVQALNGVNFKWKNGGDADLGLIAQNVETVLPELVNTNDDGIKSVKYGNIVAVLIEAIKEQQQQIDSLKQELNALKK